MIRDGVAGPIKRNLKQGRYDHNYWGCFHTKQTLCKKWTFGESSSTSFRSSSFCLVSQSQQLMLQTLVELPLEVPAAPQRSVSQIRRWTRDTSARASCKAVLLDVVRRKSVKAIHVFASLDFIDRSNTFLAFQRAKQPRWRDVPTAARAE
jgi:hypothetical protein